MTAYVKDSGSWKEATSIHVKDSGTWKEVSPGYVKDSGTWKEFGSSAPAWGNITNPENEVNWSSATTLTNAQASSLSWPSGATYFKAYIYGAGGGNSNGGQGAAGGYTKLYLAKGDVVGNTKGLVVVVGDPGQYGTPGGPHTRSCGNQGNCNGQNYGNQSARGFGGRPGVGQSPHNWGSVGGGFSGVFVNDNNTTSAQGYNYFYCTPVAIAGGGGGGQAYNSNARTGGGFSIAASVHYQSPPAAFDSLDVQDINLDTSGFGTDGNTECFSSCVFGSYPIHPYLRNQDGNTAGGFASGSSAQGGTGFVYADDGVHLSTLGFNRNSGTLSDLTDKTLVHADSATSNGGGMAVQTAGKIVYHWGT